MEKALILLVDDQLANIQAVGALLQDAGYEVMSALSGEEALLHTGGRVPVLALLDMIMPEMDGFEVCQRLQQDPRTTDVPVIFLTAAHERGTLVEAFQHGAVDYVTKPFVAEELLARVRTHIELKRARDHLALVAQERADLTQIVAHDLKNPLSSILLAAEAMDKPDASMARRSELLGDIRHSARRCLSFIDGYLGRWAASTETRHHPVTALRLGPLIHESVDGLTLLAQRRQMSIAVHIADDPEVLGHGTAIRHVLDNLISNALRYAPTGTVVEVRCETGRSGMARVSISDCGPGVPKEQQPQLFKRYVRIQSGAAVAHASGLGLAISKEEMDRMSGHLWYEDRDGGGATFSFVLPRVEAESAEASRAAGQR